MRASAACSCLAARAREKAPMRRGLPRLMGPSGSIWRPRRRETRKWRRASPATRPTEAKAGRRWRSRSKSPAPSAAEARPGRVVVVDCLTLWLSNLMLAGRDPAPAVDGLSPTPWRRSPARRSWYPTKLAWGLVPDHKLGREFRDWQGRANREIAARLRRGHLRRRRAPAPVEAGCNPERAIGLKPSIFLNKTSGELGAWLD